MPRFTPGELKVMRLLWEHGEMKPADLQERFPEPIKNPALRSYLTTLVEKGHVTRRRVGKAYFYKPVTRPRSAFRSMLGELVDAYCGGSVQALVHEHHQVGEAQRGRAARAEAARRPRAQTHAARGRSRK